VMKMVIFYQTGRFLVVIMKKNKYDGMFTSKAE
jgi:hypothetical protein